MQNEQRDFPLSRLLRVLFSVVVCLVLSLCLASLAHGPIEGHYTHRAAAPLFILAFLAPFSAIFVVVTTAILFWLDRLALKKGALSGKQTAVLLVVLVAGNLLGFLHVLVAAISLFITLYWFMTGRVAGRPGWSVRHFRSTEWDEQAYLVLVSGSLISALGSSLSNNVYFAVPPNPGTPLFQVQFEREMDTRMARATNVFPDPQSCLNTGADARTRNDLLQMDWDKISTRDDATVCVFRLLSQWGGVAEAAEWLEHQGFSVGKTFSSSSPYEAPNGTLRVDGYWSIRDNGPKYPTSGVIRRVLHAVPYNMGVNATFSSDGQELQYIQLTFSTL